MHNYGVEHLLHYLDIKILNLEGMENSGIAIYKVGPRGGSGHTISFCGSTITMAETQLKDPIDKFNVFY